MLSASEKNKILRFAEKKVSAAFRVHNVPAHDLAHIKRVRNWAVKIARAEGADVFLCELAALLHDAGRSKEKTCSLVSHFHHEASYQICREWFKNEPVFHSLSKRQKSALLYAVRYHWNDAADKYKIAWILRDADKLELFGKIGLKRAEQFNRGDQKRFELDLRLRYYNYYWLRTKTAQKIAAKMEKDYPVARRLIPILKKQIRPVIL